MAEAIFAKYSGRSINSASLISNSTKAGLGLGNGATLDDCFRVLSLADPSHATIQATLKDPDGTPLPNHKIKMADAAGTSLVYTTDALGQVVFKTSNGQATISEDYTVNNGWFDIAPAGAQIVDCPIGSVKMVDLYRTKSLTNGYNSPIYNTNQTLKFSKYADKVNVMVRGESGQGGSAGFNKAYIGTIYPWGVYNELFRPYNQYSWPGVMYTPWWDFKNNPQLSLIGGGDEVFWNNGVLALNTGGNGGLGEVKYGNNINVSNKNFSFSFPSNYIKNFSVVLSSHSSGRQLAINKPASTHVLGNLKGNSGATGRPVIAFGITASGGIGGAGGGTDANNQATSYGSGSMSGYGGTLLNARSTITRLWNTQNGGAYDYGINIGGDFECGDSKKGQVQVLNFRYK